MEREKNIIPVIWHTTFSNNLLELLREAIEDEIKNEIIAALVGKELERTETLPLVLDHLPASIFIHECVGHTSEADNYLQYILHQNDVKLGSRLTDFPLNVFDNPLITGHRRSYDKDHDGMPGRCNQLVKDGIWNELLHNKQTQKIMNAPYGGSGRRVPKMPITLPRMSVTYADAGSQKFNHIIENIEKGIYCIGAWGGGSMGTNFIVRHMVIGLKMERLLIR